MRKIYLLAASVAVLALAGLISCSSDDFLGITARARGILVDEGLSGRLVTVNAREQGDPLAGFTVTVLPDGPSVTSNEDGVFDLNATSDTNVLRLLISGTTDDGVAISDEIELTDLPEGETFTVEFVVILDRETGTFVVRIVRIIPGIDDDSSELPSAASFAATPTPTPTQSSSGAPTQSSSGGGGDDDDDNGDDDGDDEPSPFCGNGIVDLGEQCDTGLVPTAGCDTDCTAATCGDSVVNPTAGETCDTGGIPTASCDADCTSASCGDGILNTGAGETCDSAGVPTASCDIDCTSAMCGDGVTNTASGESCDSSGVNAANCDSDCSAVVCGDGLLNLEAGECEDSSRFCPDDCNLVQ